MSVCTRHVILLEMMHLTAVLEMMHLTAVLEMMHLYSCAQLQRFCRFIVKAADYPRVHCKVHVVRSSITSLNWRV